jgi:glycosyltransferase involved in cell wall biosynthesis
VTSRWRQRPAHSRVRVYQSVRSAHLERAQSYADATIYYQQRRYDFDTSLVGGLDLIPAGRRRLFLSLLGSRPTILEINEPLMRSALSFAATAVLAIRLTDALTRRRTTVVSYAIENLDPFIASPPTTRARLRRLTERVLSNWCASQLDRIVYGTESARELYQHSRGKQLRRAAAQLIPAIPTRCECAERIDALPHSALFVGALQPRKGFPELARAWPLVKRALPDASLTVIGKGDLEHAALQLAEQCLDVTVLIDPPRSLVHQHLRQAAVAILLSQRTPRWREQVGLPIVEGLAHGCRIVTTDETGLHGWLVAHGHFAVKPGAGDAEVAAVIESALRGATDAEAVLGDLPAVDGRLAADRVLIASATPPGDAVSP